ncbi:hypothetical protein p2A209 (plasmid) [Aromatoleum aromaticum EbN1]|uniref:Uncharacterized protein n=1 Tax=Aromatoleum aromaticum (strain DSM 19018 / LMG 30748 / EbN1) TaxID=76114 RepID=Q5NWD5_AROAE|nr:hypothetical protein [Aromatoleum aromaticum]CAI10629.1 hypothetical protein p2A209 [Aromatoleum aromaticum EbN1]
MGATTEIVENWNFVTDFPELPGNLIERPHLLLTMAEALSSEAPILFLEGEEGDGATTTLAQFCHLYPTQTFSLFIKPASRITYGLEYLRLALAEQFHWYVYGETLRKDLLSVSEFEDLRLKALRHHRSQVLYFVIDGLHQIPLEDRSVISQVFKELLPTGASRCRFIVTGQQAELGSYIHVSVKSKHYRLLKLSLDECGQFLRGTGIEDRDCKKVYELCKGGSPGRIAVIRRLLLAGTSLSAILETDPAKYLEFVKLEFEVLRELRENELLVVSSIAFSKIGQSVKDLCALSGAQESEIAELLAKCQFLKISPSQGVEFISETHRKYAAKQLESLQRSALEAQLTYLQQNPRSETSLRFLPAYLETLNRQEAILQLLSSDYYSDLLQTTQSFSALKTQAEMGARSAQALKRAHDVFKFSLQRSIFASTSMADGSSDRVKALVALGKSNAAMALANAEATKEDRLALLSAFARRLSERNGKLDSEIAEYIKRLIAEVDFSSMGDMAMNIAADILMFDPDAAIGIIESAVKGATAAVKDAAYAELSFSASLAKLKHKAKIEDKARARISDQALQHIAYSFELMAERLDSMELMGILSRMPTAHQVYFLRSFVNIKRKDPRILDLIELGLDIIIKEIEYTPRAKDLAELCAPFLVTIEDRSRLKRLVTRFDSQLGLVGKAAQSRDLTVLQMRLAAAEYQYEKQLACQRVAQTYYEVLDIKTPEVQLECLAIMLGALAKLDKEGVLEAQEGFRAVIKADLDKLLAVVLKDTGDHISTVSPALKALAADDCKAALDLAGGLNILPRRDVAYQTVAAILVAQRYNEPRLASVKQALNLISCDDLRSRATEDLLSYLDANADKSAWVPHVEGLRQHLMSAYALSHWDCWMFKASAAGGLGYNIQLLCERIREALARVGSPLEEAKVYFRAAEALAEGEPDIAQQYYNEGLRVSRATPFSSGSTAKLFELCLSLVGRSMAPLARSGMLDGDKLSRHATLIDHLPGIIPKVRVLNEIAERMWCAKREDLANRLVSEQLRPLLEQARTTHASIGRTAIRIAFPSLCASHLRLAVPLLLELPDTDADGALLDASMLRVRHLCSQEPDGNGRSDYSKLEAGDIADVIELVQHARMDSTIFSIIKTLVEAISDRANKTRFTASQKADWSSRLRPIVDEKLPDQKNIKHDGYQIVCLAQIYSLVDFPWSQWDALEKRAQAIDNCADRGFIYTELAAALPRKFAESHRKRLLNKAVEEINKIPSPVDRLSHLQGYVQEAHANDSAASARECLKAAMKLSIEIEGHSQVAQHRRELIDIADQIDPGLADELIELVDDDPARAELKSDAKQAAALAKAKREMANAKQLKDAVKCEIDLLPLAAWRNLGALEAGRLEVKAPEVMTSYVTMAADGTLHQAYPVLSWHLANMERKYVQQQDVRSHLVPICEALLLSTELTYSLLRKVSGKGADVREETGEEGMLVRRRSRAEAVAYIENWLQQNADEYVVYCDAYFSTRDIHLLRVCLAQAPQCKVYVIASKPHLLKERELGEEPFERAWREQSDQDPPETEIIAPAFVDAPNKHVLHDRWLLTKDAGLRLGTSFNSLGVERLTEVSEMETTQVNVLREQIEKYLNRQRVVDGARIQYSSFTL